MALAFVATLALFVLASEALVRNHVIPQDNFEAHVSLLERSSSSDAAFGDSHTARGFAASDGFVNLAFPSEGISHMAWKVETHFADRVPGRVILQATPHLFANYRLSRSFEPYPRTVAGRPSPMGFYLTQPRHRARLPGYWTRYIESGFTLESTDRQTESGSLLSKGDFSQLAPRAQTLQAVRRARTHQLAGAEPIAKAQGQYSAMLDRLLQQGAQVCLVTYPVSDAYFEAVQDAHQPMIRYFEGEAARTGARYLDARQVVSDQARFRDSDHLNEEGAILFSQTLVDFCFG